MLTFFFTRYATLEECRRKWEAFKAGSQLLPKNKVNVLFHVDYEGEWEVITVQDVDQML